MEEDVTTETSDKTKSSNSDTIKQTTTNEEDADDKSNAKKRKIGVELDTLVNQKDLYKKHLDYFMSLYKKLQNMQNKIKNEL
jgi:hypothetical protein